MQPFSELVGSKGQQRHHIYQDGAMSVDASGKKLIPRDDGPSVLLKGSAFKDGTMHSNWHSHMDDFFDAYRGSDERPSFSEYEKAAKEAFMKAGLTPGESRTVMEAARAMRRERGISDSDLIPAIPKRIKPK